METGLFGHIVYYGNTGLRYLLGDCWLEVSHSTAFKFPFYTPGNSALARLGERIELTLTNGLIETGKHLWRFPAAMNATTILGEVIYLEARKGISKEIPFAL